MANFALNEPNDIAPGSQNVHQLQTDCATVHDRHHHPSEPATNLVRFGLDATAVTESDLVASERTRVTHICHKAPRDSDQNQNPLLFW
jgi:hypothetical protein